jgi:hypothetical protein
MTERYINIGYVKDFLTKKLINSLNEGVQDDYYYINKFIDIISESEILKKEYDLFESLSNNKIPSEIVASRFLDKSISIFENYTREEIDNAHSKLEELLDETITINPKKIEYYRNVSDLIYESLKTNENTNTHLLFESFSNVLSVITKNQKEVKVEPKKIVNENVLNIATNKFNEKYSNLSESDISLLKKIVSSSYDEKKQIYEDFKQENLNLLNNMLVNEEYQDKTPINNAIQNINSFNLNEETVIDNIIKLYELNNGLKE